MSQIFGDISWWCRRHADGCRFAHAASFPVREGGDASYHYDSVTLEEGDDDDDGGYDYAPAA